MGQKEIFIEQCNKFLEEHKSEYDDKVLIRSAIIKSKSGDWINCLTTFRILKKDEEIKRKDDIIYDNFALLEEIVTLSNFKKIINHLWGGLQIKNYDIRFDAVKYDSKYLGTNNIFSEWPGLYFEVVNSQGTEYYPELYQLKYPPVKYGVLPFSSCYEAIGEWVNIENFKGTEDERLGGILIFLPNYKARIKSLVYDNGVIKLNIDGINEYLNNLECKFEMKYENKTIRRIIILNNNKVEATIEVDDIPIQTFVQIVTPSGELLDAYFENQFGHTGKIRFIRKGIDKEVLNLIQNGENEHVEFKPFIKIGDNKEKEVIETIIAFANTESGSILIGVSDYSEIKGIPKETVEGYKKHLRKIVSDAINRGVSLNFFEHNINDKIILEVKVEEGDKKPYSSIRDNSIYVRKGSNNRRPTDEELRGIYSKFIN